MITLNILPPTKKEELRLNNLYMATKNLIILILILTILAAIALLFTKMTLQNYFNNIVEQTTLTTKYTKVFSKDIRDLNRDLKAVEKIQNDHTYWTKFFIKFSPLVPDDIGIYSININQNKILITGQARTREQLLQFKDNLEKSDLLDEVTIPLENLLKKENIDFDIKTTINLETLK